MSPDATSEETSRTRGWVEHWLDRYCPPGEHNFRIFELEQLTCGECGKHRLADHSTCMVCDIPGDRDATLISSADPERRLEGHLCGPCMDDFRGRGLIRGWSLADGNSSPPSMAEGISSRV